MGWRANPFGVVLFACVVVMGACGGVELVTGRNVIGALRPGLWCLWVMGGMMLVGWGWKLTAGLISGEFPIR